ncbi:HD domain-containing protein [Bombilactobacillus folatiphilus]|uniref:HD domain-containing protein n=1 Tax=Bombilactobacillus folatiphilus TaxID=2923362 RepID=A0ABY4P9P0_9LACO|nr:HD domain-containing protein [Bombilactobacillus folatiphilus]UQS82429.1 HD domain-containing protein [Bombilactobacillus folatiphilus]
MNLMQIQSFAQKTLGNDVSGHDYNHVCRVASLAVNLYQTDQPLTPDITALLQAASLLHDTIDDKLTDDILSRKQQLMQLLTEAGFDESQQQEIMQTITKMSFAQNLQHKQVLPTWGQYVQDADRLDALGAIGIARAFAYGASHKQLLYDPQLKPIELTSKTNYRQHQTTTINHFYEKLFHLEQLMNTTAGQQLAHQRTTYMRNFVQQFSKEWQGQI